MVEVLPGGRDAGPGVRVHQKAADIGWYFSKTRYHKFGRRHRAYTVGTVHQSYTIRTLKHHKKPTSITD